MRLRLTLLATLVAVGVALAAPGTAAAASPYSYSIVKNYCNGGEPNIVIRLFKPAGYYPDKFTMDAQGQHRNVGFTKWSTESSNSHFQTYVPYQYAKWSWKQAIYWDPPDTQWHRIRVNLRVWSGGNVVGHKTVYSKAC